MAISLQDLDHILGYDPDSHTLKGLPSIAGADTKAQPVLTPMGTPSGTMNRIPAVGAPSSAPNIAQPSAPPPSMPVIKTDIGPGGQSFATIPDLKKPETGWQKFGHGLARVGETIGDAIAPGTMAMIPGTSLNKAWEQKREAGLAREGAETDLEKAQAENQKAEAWKSMHPTATTPFEQWEKQNPDAPLSDWVKIEQSERPATEFTEWEKQNPNAPISEYFKAEQGGKAPTAEQDKQFMGQAEQNLANGSISTTDRQKLAGMQREQKLTGLGPEIVAQIGQPPVPADYPGGEKDQKYIADNKKWGQDAEAVKNQEGTAAATARGEAYGMFRPVQVLMQQPDGSMQAQYMTAGEAEKLGVSTAQQGTKAMSQQAQFADINNAIQKVGDALSRVGDSAFTPSQNAKLTLAMQETDPTVMRNEIANLAASGLTPQQQDLVTWLQQLNERALSLRNIAGMGQGSDTVRMAIQKALPSITSGNVQMAQKQLGALQNMVDNLHRGILGVKGSNAGGWTAPTDAPAAPKEDGKLLMKDGKPVAKSAGGQWVQP